jgi:hypothetical protein
MDAKIRSTLNCALRDGRIQKSEIKELAQAALDGKGVTKNEAADLQRIRDKFGDQMTRGAKSSLDNFLGHAKKSWSRTKKVHLPNVDEDKLKDLMNSDPRVSLQNDRVSGGESGGGGSRRVGGGESGGSSRPAPRPSRRVGGGE